MAFTFFCILSTASAQLNWNITNEKTEDSEVYSFLGESEQGYGFVFTFPTQKAFSSVKYGIAIRHFDQDMRQTNQIGLPDNMPPFLRVRGFNDYIVVSGGGGGDRDVNGYNVTVFLDDQGLELEQKSWKLSGNRHLWAGSNTWVSSDSAYFIVCKTEQCIPDKPSLDDDPLVNHVVVFDGDLKIVWEGSYENLSFSPKKNALKIEGMDFINDKQLLIFGTETIDKQPYAVAYTLPDAKSNAVQVLKEKIPIVTSAMIYTYLNTYFFLSPSNDLFVFSYYTKDGIPQNMQFIRQNLDNVSDKKVSYYRIDKNFAAKYPYFGKGNKQFPVFTGIRLWNDGLIVGGEYFTESPVSLRDISLLKFGYDGDIQWVKTIKKTSYGISPVQRNMMRFFTRGDELVVFYYDFPENVTSDVLITNPRVSLAIQLPNQSCLATALISSDGKVLNRKILNRYKENQITIDNSTIFQADEDHYIIQAAKDYKNAFSTYSME